MTEFAPMFYTLLVIVILGTVIPALILPFDEAPYPPNNPLVSFFTEMVEEGFVYEIPLLPDIHFNPFNPVGAEGKETLSSYLRTFNVIPYAIAFPLLIILILAFAYSLFKLAPTT